MVVTPATCPRRAASPRSVGLIGNNNNSIVPLDLYIFCMVEQECVIDLAISARVA